MSLDARSVSQHRAANSVSSILLPPESSSPIQRAKRLLGLMRRERNGVVADTMLVVGRGCGLNYGVSLATVRQIARTECKMLCDSQLVDNNGFARFLWLMDVRELRLAALHIVSPEALTLSTLPAWEAGIINSELAEEMAFALLARCASLPEIFARWVTSDAPLLQYAALLAAARVPRAEWLGATVEALNGLRAEDAAASYLIPRGVVAMLSALAMRDPVQSRAVGNVIDSMGDSLAEEYVREEVGWLTLNS